MEGAGTLKNVTFLNHLEGEVNQIWTQRNVPLSCHLNSYLSSLVASACAVVLMILRGAHSWLTAPHPSVAFSISVRPNGIRSVIIRLFTVHAGLTVNFWDMRPLSSSNLFFSELQHRFISLGLTARVSHQSSNRRAVSLFRFLFTVFDHKWLLFTGGAFWGKERGASTYGHAGWLDLKWRWHDFHVCLEVCICSHIISTCRYQTVDTVNLKSRADGTNEVRSLSNLTERQPLN